jgi:hypothetical protein
MQPFRRHWGRGQSQLETEPKSAVMQAIPRRCLFSRHWRVQPKIILTAGTMKLLDRLAERFPSLKNSNLDSTSYEVRARARPGNRFAFVARKVLMQLVITPFYVAFAAPFAVVGAYCWRFRLSKEERQLLHSYCEQFWYYPSLCIHKAVEGRLFRTVRVLAPSCEIGCEDGIVTSLHFPGEAFDLGIEYIAANLPRNSVHRSLRVAGLPNLPGDLDGGFSTIVLVHVIDHIPDLDGSLRSLRRIARPGAHIGLSGLADGYPRHLRRASLGLLGPGWLNERKGLYHFQTAPQWRASFEGAGFRVIRLETFLGGARGFFWTVLHSIFEINGSNDLWYAADRMGFVPAFVRRRICVPMAEAIASWFLLDRSPDTSPCHFFAELAVPETPSDPPVERLS